MIEPEKEETNCQGNLMTEYAVENLTKDLNNLTLSRNSHAGESVDNSINFDNDRETAVKTMDYDQNECGQCRSIISTKHFEVEPEVEVTKSIYNQDTARENCEEPINSIFDQLLEDYRNDPVISENIVVLPEVEVNIGGLRRKALSDTGASTSCIGYSFYLELSEKHPNLPYLTANALRVTAAYGSRVAKVEGQTLLPIEINDENYETLALIIKDLNRDVILGASFFNETQAVVDFKEHELVLNQPRLNTVKFSTKSVEVNELVARVICDSMDDEISVASLNEVRNVYPAKAEIDKPTIASEEDIFKHVSSYTDLSDREKKELLRVLMDHRMIFDDKPGLVTNYTHHIELTDDTPIKVKTYPYPIKYRHLVDEEIRKLERWGVIQKAPTDWINPLVIVPKTVGIRICTDARVLNRRMKGQIARPIPPLEFLQEMSGKSYYTTLDGSQFFRQLNVNPDHRKYLGFVHRGQSYVQNRVAFGLKTAVSSCVTALDDILGPNVQSYCNVFIDDVLIASDSFDEHLYHLRDILERLQKRGVTLKLSKCVFARNSVKTLGYILSQDGLGKDAEKIQTIQDMKPPKTVKTLQSLLGYLNFYRNFSYRYAELAKPLLELLKKGRKFKWEPKHQEAFEKIKEAFQEEVVLKKPLEDSTYYLEVDASGWACAALLYQYDTEGNIRIIGMTSRVFQPAEVNYSTTEKEMMSFIHGVTKFKLYLVNTKFVVRSDHKSLQFILKCKLTNARITRWVLLLANLDFVFEHVPGCRNIADYFSRNPLKVPIEKYNRGDLIPPESIMAIKELIPVQLRSHIAMLPELQTSDPFYGDVKSKVLKGENVSGDRCQYEIVRNLLCKRDNEGIRICVPEALIPVLMEYYHDNAGHPGAGKLIPTMKQYYVWKHMAKGIRRYCASCMLCQRNNPPHTYHRGPLHSVVVKNIGDLVSTDWYGPLVTGRGGVSYVLVFLDNFSKLVSLYACRRATARTAIAKLKDYLRINPGVKCICSDNGSQYTSGYWKAEIQNMGIKHITITAYYPQANTAERIMRSLGKMLRIYCHDKQKQWPVYLGHVEKCMNLIRHESTGQAPYSLHFGISPSREVASLFGLPEIQKEECRQYQLELARKTLQTKAEKRKERFDKSHKLVTFKEGQLVMCRIFPRSDALAGITRKLLLTFEGPKRIIKELHPNAYLLAEVESDKIFGKRNAFHLKPFHEREREK